MSDNRRLSSPMTTAERRLLILDTIQGNPGHPFTSNVFRYRVTKQTILRDLVLLTQQHEEIHERKVRGFTSEREFRWCNGC